MTTTTTMSPQGAGESLRPMHRILWYGLCAVLFWLYASPLLYQDSFFQMSTDEANYAWKAEHISRDLGTLATERAWRRHPPLIPTIVGLVARVVSLQTAILITTKTLAIIGIVMVYMVGVQLKGPIAGLVAAVLIAANPTYRSISNKLLLDIPLMILFVVCASFLLRGGRFRICAVVTGIVALFVKDYGILVLVFPLACIGWDFLINRGWRPLMVVSVVLLASAFIMLPVGYFQGHIPCCDWLGWGRWLFQKAEFRFWRILDTSIGWMVPGIPKRYLGLFLLLSLPFLGRMLSFSQIRTNVILCVWVALVFAPFLIVYTGDERVVLLFLPALYLAVGVCLAQAIQLVRTMALRRSLATFVLAGCVLVLLMARRNPDVLYYTECRFRAYYPTGEWIRRNVSSSGAVVFTRSNHQVRFYASSELERDGGIFFGRDEWTGIPYQAPEFKRVLEKTEKTAYFIVDIEEKGDPPWLYPPTRNSAEVIQALGFHVVHLVWLPVGSLCDIPDSPYYAELPSFLKQLGLPLYRNNGTTKERVGAVVFKRNGAPSPMPPKESAHRLLTN